jgi:ankyrin repeat protein
LEYATSGSGEVIDTPMLTLHPPLTGAAFAGQLECVTVLLDEVKVSIDEYDQNGPSIGYAAAAGHGDVVKFLLSRGAAIVTKPETPDILSLALKGGSLDAVNSILESEQWRSSEREVTVDICHLPHTVKSSNLLSSPFRSADYHSRLAILAT